MTFNLVNPLDRTALLSRPVITYSVETCSLQPPIYVSAVPDAE